MKDRISEDKPQSMISFAEQLKRWADGESIHAGQCCPDFSCCKPELQAPEAERKLFVERPGPVRLAVRRWRYVRGPGSGLGVPSLRRVRR